MLFDDAEPGDILQGMLGVTVLHRATSPGDCWLLAAIACVAEFPNFFRDYLFVTQEWHGLIRKRFADLRTQEIPDDGKYQLKLFDCKLQDPFRVFACPLGTLL